MKFEKELTQVAYVVAIDIEDFLAITRHDDRAISSVRGGKKTLDEQLLELDAVLKVDYNGHFGSNLFI